MSYVQLNALRKSYGRHEVIHGIDLDIREGEFIVFVGPSGCGKSTLLRMLAGLEEITQGDLMIAGQRANGLTPTERGIAMVFQNYALYPHMTVAQNIGFGLKMLGMSKAEIQAKVAEAAEKLRLTEYLGRKPAALSGGQRQRVAIGRAIVRDPALFLFDEPLSNLDAELRVSMRIEIARLHREIGVTMVYVTHDQTEAMTLADRIVVLNQGRIEQVGTPRELYEKPANLFVAGFMGSPAMNFLPDELVAVAAPGGNATRPVAKLGIRPEHLELSSEGSARMTVEAIEYLGGTRYVYGSVNGAQLIVEKREGEVPGPGESVGLYLPPEKLHRFDAQGLRVG